MRQGRSSRESGAALVMTLIILTMVMAFSAAFTVTSLVGLQTMTEGEQVMRAHYLADTGSQIGIAKVRASGGTLNSTTLTETIDQGTATVDIVKNADLYTITSTGNVQGRQRKVQASVFFKTTGGYSGDAGVPVTIGSSTTLYGGSTVKIRVDAATTKISGMDHDSNGVLKADQSKARYGLTLDRSTPPYEKVGPGTIEGAPQPFLNTTVSRQTTVEDAITSIKANANITLTGSKKVTLGTAQTGLYGAPGAPKIVYANIGSGAGCEAVACHPQFVMTGDFSGYGTLLIEVTDAQMETPILDMMTNAKWTGLIIIQFKGIEADFANDGGAYNPALKLRDSAKIIGSAELFFNSTTVEWTDLRYSFVQLLNSAQLLYSSSVVSSSPGTGSGGSKTAEFASYRRL